MKLKALIAAPIVAWLMIASAATIEKPMGWSWGATGSRPESYEIGVDSSMTRNGKPSLTVQAKEQRATAFGDIHQYVQVPGYSGKRVRFSGMLRVSSVDGWAGTYLWAGDRSTQNFDLLAMPLGSGRKGNDTQWQPVSVVIDVPDNADLIRMGLILMGNGQAWLSDLKFEEVGAEVAVTTSKVEVDTAQVLRDKEEIKKWTRQQPKAVPANLELRTK
jgi:hypothetical protein